MTGLSSENVDMSPGDLLIFNSLSHGVRPNHSENRAQMAQYISIYPANQHDESECLECVRLWTNIEPPARPDFPGDPRDWEKCSYGKPYLNALGRKLLGLKIW